jgi:hypothetical protein
MYLNEEISRLKLEVESLLKQESIMSDEVVMTRIKEVRTLLESFSVRKTNDKMINKILKIQNLIREANE